MRRNPNPSLARIVASLQQKPTRLLSPSVRTRRILTRPPGEMVGTSLLDAMKHLKDLGEIVQVHDPRVGIRGGKTAYNDIEANLEKWIEDAIKNRRKYT